MITTDPLNAPNMVFSAPAVPDDFDQTFNWCITTLGDLATHLGTYATGIQNILDATDKPMGEIVNASQGEAAQVLSVTWASTRVDGTNARQALIAAQ
ncbi:MAG TPA: hypothetical protein VHD63_09455, partial [Ktedonobacteraceae bacterium]|nr:hypothetical protein [Ktedonobacteraceae bacterium]